MNILIFVLCLITYTALYFYQLNSIQNSLTKVPFARGIFLYIFLIPITVVQIIFSLVFKFMNWINNDNVRR